jgi:type IV pilus assembly protein PilZ
VTEADRRSASRAPIALSVEYKRVNSFFADYTRNISKGGTFIRTDRPLDLGTEFVFELRVRGLDEGLRLRGRVKWSVRVEDATPGSPAGMGIEFLWNDDDERDRVTSVVEGLLANELGPALAARLLGR